MLLFVATLTVALSTGTSTSTECMSLNGADYRGEQHSAAGGEQCLNWLQIQSRHNVSQFTSSSGVSDHSRCRNPDQDTRPWCYVTEGGGVVRRHCNISTCPVHTALDEDVSTTTVVTAFSKEELLSEEVEPPPPSNDDVAVQPVIGISQRVRQGSKGKKDLGVVGKALAIGMMVIIIVLGAGITLGYFYKRGKDLKKQQEQRAYEREMHRITLPLSAFSNPTCELIDENIVVIENPQTHISEPGEGHNPLIDQAGTPGA